MIHYVFLRNNHVFLYLNYLFIFSGRFPIRHLKCVSEKTNESGVCMFAFTCARANGTHLGVCVDGFIYGSCCKVDDIPGVPTQNTNAIEDTNDVPGNVDKNHALITKKPLPSSSSLSPAKTTSTTLKWSSTKTTESTTSKSTEQIVPKTEGTTVTHTVPHFQTSQSTLKTTTKTKPTSKPPTKRPVVQSTTPTASTIKLTTFQSILENTTRPTRPSLPDPKPITPRPRPSPSILRTTTQKSIVTSSEPPISIYTLALSSKTPVTARPFNKRPKPSKITSTTSPTSTQKFSSSTTSQTSPSSTEWTKLSSTSTFSSSSPSTSFLSSSSTPISSTTTTTTQRIIPITRFPPRNVTTPSTSTTTDHHLENLIEDTQLFLNNITLEITRRPPGTKRPVMPSSTPEPLDSLIQISNQLMGNLSNNRPVIPEKPQLSTTESVVTFLDNFTKTSSTTQLHNVTLEITRKPISTSTRKPVTKKPIKEPTKRPPTKRPVVPSRRPQLPPIFETKKPTTVPSSTSVTSSSVDFTKKHNSTLAYGSKITTESTISNEIILTPSTAAPPNVTSSIFKFPTSTSHKPSLPIVPMTKPILTTTIVQNLFPSTTTATKNATKFTFTTAGSSIPTTTTTTTTKTTTTTILPPLIFNEVDGETDKETTLQAVPTTLPPGLVTWSSFPTDRFEQINTTKVSGSPSPTTPGKTLF